MQTFLDPSELAAGMSGWEDSGIRQRITPASSDVFLTPEGTKDPEGYSLAPLGSGVLLSVW